MKPFNASLKKPTACFSFFKNQMNVFIKTAAIFSFAILFSIHLPAQTITIDGNPSDWPAVLNSSSIPVKVFNHDVANSFTDNIFGLGSKDVQEISSWRWTTGSFISDTRDIENGGAALIGDKLYFFGDIIDPTDALTTFGIWLLLDNVAPTGTSGSGFTGSHTIGDILIVLQISAGSETVSVETWQWVGFGASSTGLALLSATTSAALNTIQQSVPVFPGWTYSGAGGPSFYSIKSFFEGSLNVASLSNRCFKTFLIETRSSTAETASLTDFAIGAFGGSADVDNDGFTVCNDCNDNDATVYPGAAEICDGKDNDCDGQTDEGFSLTTYYLDADADGYGNFVNSIQACSQPAGYATVSGDCNDNNAAINPGATEVCDGIDNNCNSGVDEGLPETTYYKDLDNDGYGSSTTVQRCSQPAGWVTISGDCNDNNAAINPNAIEVCDGVDNNCNGQVDEGCSAPPTITINDITVNESQGLATLTVTLSNTSNVATKITFKTNDGTATSMGKNKDFKAVNNGNVIIPAGNTTGNISITIYSDNISESSEYFDVQLTKTTNGIISDNTGRITITEGLNRITSTQQSHIVEIFPNPTPGDFIIRPKVISKTFSTLNVKIIDGTGKIINQMRVSSIESIQFGSNLKPGIYFAEVSQGTQRQMIKLVKF